jgi:O-antigen/teichoic acid export membrane protein
VNVAGQLALMTLGLVANALVYRRLGGEVLGLYYLSLAIAAIAGTVVDGGLTMLVIRETAGRRGSEPAAVLALQKLASFLVWSSCALAVALLAASAPWVVRGWLQIETLAPGPAAIAFTLFVLAALVGVPRNLYAGMLRGLGRFGASNTVGVGTQALQTLGAVALLLAGAHVVGFAAWYALVGLLSVAVAAAVVARASSATAIVPHWSADAFRRARGFLGWTALISAAAGVLSYCDRLILAAYVPAEELAFYGTAASLSLKARQIIGSVGQVGLPALSEAHGAGDEEGVRRRYRLFDELIRVGSVPLFAACALGARPVLALVFDPAAADGMVLPVACLCFAGWANGVLNTPYQLSLVYDRADISARQNLYALALVVPATILLTWRFGLPGAGAGPVVYQLFALGFAIPRFARALPIGSASAWFARLAGTFLAAVVAYGGAMAFTMGRPARDLVSPPLAWIAGTIVFAALAWILASPESRAEARRRLRYRDR